MPLDYTVSSRCVATDSPFEFLRRNLARTPFLLPLEHIEDLDVQHFIECVQLILIFIRPQKVDAGAKWETLWLLNSLVMRDSLGGDAHMVIAVLYFATILHFSFSRILWTRKLLDNLLTFIVQILPQQRLLGIQESSRLLRINGLSGSLKTSTFFDDSWGEILFRLLSWCVHGANSAVWFRFALLNH